MCMHALHRDIWIILGETFFGTCIELSKRITVSQLGVQKIGHVPQVPHIFHMQYYNYNTWNRAWAVSGGCRIL